MLEDVEFSDGYRIEDKRNLGWGYVISRDDEWVMDRRMISTAVNQFLIDTEAVISKVKGKHPRVKPILRMGFYYDSYTFTMNFFNESIKQMSEIGIDLELSLYPSCEDE